MSGVRALVEYVGDALALTSERGAAAVLRLYLAGILLYAGILKLRRPWTPAAALVDFGVLRRPSARAGRVLGLAEVTTGVFLVMPGPAGVVGQIAAVALFASFTSLLARSLRRGEHFPCGCFGEDARELSASTLARTAGLLLLAAVLLGSGGASVDIWQDDVWAYALVIGTGAALLPAVGLRVLDGHRTTKKLLTTLDWENVFVGRIGGVGLVAEQGYIASKDKGD